MASRLVLLGRSRRCGVLHLAQHRTAFLCTTHTNHAPSGYTSLSLFPFAVPLLTGEKAVLGQQAIAKNEASRVRILLDFVKEKVHALAVHVLHVEETTRARNDRQHARDGECTHKGCKRGLVLQEKKKGSVWQSVFVARGR